MYSSLKVNLLLPMNLLHTQEDLLPATIAAQAGREPGLVLTLPSPILPLTPLDLAIPTLAQAGVVLHI
jgi:hypothetical protein